MATTLTQAEAPSPHTEQSSTRLAQGLATRETMSHSMPMHSKQMPMPGRTHLLARRTWGLATLIIRTLIIRACTIQSRHREHQQTKGPSTTTHHQCQPQTDRSSTKASSMSQPRNQVRTVVACTTRSTKYRSRWSKICWTRSVADSTTRVRFSPMLLTSL